MSRRRPLSLGIGVAANMTIYRAVDVFMLRPLPYPEYDDLYFLYTSNRERGWMHCPFRCPSSWTSASQTLAAGEGASPLAPSIWVVEC